MITFGKLVPTTLLILFFLVCTTSCQARRSRLGFSELDRELRSIITSKTASDADLLEAISRLGKVDEPPEFWTQIANDPAYGVSHRTRAVFALFLRHVAPRVDGLVRMGEILSPAKWLSESCIARIDWTMGPLPVEFNSGESVFEISVFYGPAIYFRVLGDWDEYDCRKLLKNERIENQPGDDVILQYGFSDDYERWLAPQSR